LKSVGGDIFSDVIAGGFSCGTLDESCALFVEKLVFFLRQTLSAVMLIAAADCC
jgi:hypothetical protein